MIIVNPYQIKPYDTEEIIELKKQIQRASKQQDQLLKKYKSVRQYVKLQQDISLMAMKIEQLWEEK